MARRVGISIAMLSSTAQVGLLLLVVVVSIGAAEVDVIERSLRHEMEKNVALAKMAENLNKLRGLVDTMLGARQHAPEANSIAHNLEGSVRTVSRILFGSQKVDDFGTKSVGELQIIIQSVDRLLDNIYNQLPLLSKAGTTGGNSKVTREEPMGRRIHNVLTQPQAVVQSLINNDREKVRKKESVERMMRIMEERGRK